MVASATNTKLGTKIISVLSSLILALALIPAAAFQHAAYADSAAPSWYNTTSTEFLLTTANQLTEFAAIVNGTQAGVEQDSFEGKTIIIANNIALSGEWTPIGNATYAFKGTFEGKNRTISGLSITSQTTGYVGLFGNSSGTVRNFKLTGSISTTTTANYVGGVVAYNAGTISNVVSSVEVTASSASYVGGIAGFNDGGYNASIGTTPTGGQGQILQCSCSANVTGSTQVGGIVGENAGAISECCATGTVDGTNASSKNGVGGIAGRNGNNNAALEYGTIDSCYFMGTVGRTGQKWVGGITGFCAGQYGNTSAQPCEVTNCYMAGTLVAGGGYDNAIIGKVDDSTVVATNNYALSYAANTGSSTAEIGVVKTADEMQEAAFVTALGSAYAADENAINGGFPVLAWQNEEAEPVSDTALLSTTATDVRVGDTFTVDIKAYHRGNIYAAQASLSFNPSVATVEQVEYASGLENTETEDIDNVAGTVGLSFYGDVAKLATYGTTIATVTFRAVSEGTASITATDAVAASSATESESATADINLTTSTVPTTVPVNEKYIFTVYSAPYNWDGTSETTSIAKQYTLTDLKKLADAQTSSVAGQYNTSDSMGVWAAQDYVTFQTLVEQAGLKWSDGAIYTWGEDYANSFSYQELQERSFYPEAAASAQGYTYSTDNAEAVQPCLALNAHRAFVSAEQGGYATAQAAADAALASTETSGDDYTQLLTIIGASESDYVAGEVAADAYVCDAQSITVIAPAFTIYSMNADGSDLEVAKGYTYEELLEMVDEAAEPVAGEYIKDGSIAVWASSQYVTFQSLIEAADLTWDYGYTYVWGGDASQGKSANAYSYGQLQNRYFYPNASVGTKGLDYNTEGAQDVQPCLALMAHRKFVSSKEGDFAIASEAKEAALADESTSGDNAVDMVTIIGADEENYSVGTAPGKPFWRNTTEIYVVAPNFTVSDETYAAGKYLVTYTGEVAQGSVPSMNGTAMCLEDGQYVALATAEEVELLGYTSFTVAEGTAEKIAGVGDVNGNSKVNIVDAQIAYDLACGVYTDFSVLSQKDWLEADVTRDGLVRAEDARLIQYAVVHPAA